MAVALHLADLIDHEHVDLVRWAFELAAHEIVKLIQLHSILADSPMGF